MGRDKAFVELNDRPLYGWVRDALAAAGCQVVAAGRAKPVGSLPTYPDRSGESRRGPVAGLARIAAEHDERDLVLVATDQPLLRAATVAELLTRPGPVVAPIAAGVTQVTCAVYRPRLIGQDLINGAASLQHLVTEVGANLVPDEEWLAWGEDGRSWFSVTPPKTWLTRRSCSRHSVALTAAGSLPR